MGTVIKLVRNQRLNCKCGCNEWHVWMDGNTIDSIECVSCHTRFDFAEEGIELELE